MRQALAFVRLSLPAAMSAISTRASDVPAASAARIPAGDYELDKAHASLQHERGLAR